MKILRSVIVSCVVTVLSAAQTVPADSLLSAIESSYNAGQYLSAEVDARRALEQNSLSDSAVVQLERWIAFSLIAQGRSSAARDRFVAILKRDASFELDPVLTSPKILSVFNDARTVYAAWKRTVMADSLRSLPESTGSPRRTVTFRTVVFPGWEQIYQGREQTGYLLLGAGVATLVSGISFEFLRADARQRYLDAATAAEITSAYDTYNTYRKGEIYSFLAFGVIYGLSEWDVFTHSGVTVTPMVSADRGTGITLSIRR